MKTRCMCGKPDRIMRSGRVNIDFYPKRETLLHFKVATTECERCGRGLCEDCVKQGIMKVVHPGKEISWTMECAEVCHACWR